MRKATDAAAWPFQRGAAAFLVAVAFDAARGLAAGLAAASGVAAGAAARALGLAATAPGMPWVAIFAAMSVAVFSAPLAISRVASKAAWCVPASFMALAANC